MYNGNLGPINDRCRLIMAGWTNYATLTTAIRDYTEVDSNGFYYTCVLLMGLS